MCTVTFVPTGKQFIFTSSRDEQAARMPAMLPEIVVEHGMRMIYPKDPQGGGSWIAANELGQVAILLNGAIKRHQSTPPYKKSRGLILTDIISAKSSVDRFEEWDFNGIEPFTLILFEEQKLYCGRWDSRMKWIESIDLHKPHIWSSVTLYNEEAVEKRQRWFSQWIEKNKYPGTLDIIHFHQKAGDGDPYNDIRMKRDDGLFTNSISSIRWSADAINFRHLDLRNDHSSENQFPIQNDVALQA